MDEFVTLMIFFGSVVLALILMAGYEESKDFERMSECVSAGKDWVDGNCVSTSK